MGILSEDGDLEVETFFKMVLDTVKYREILDTLYGREVHLFTHCHIKVRQFSSLCKIEIAMLTLKVLLIENWFFGHCQAYQIHYVYQKCGKRFYVTIIEQ